MKHLAGSVLAAARRRAVGAGAAAALALLAGPAAAQPSPSDDAFLQGKALMTQGRIDEACEKLAESLALERRGGTLLNLAVCREKQGRFATALRLFHEAREHAAKDGNAERVALADERIKAVQGLVSWLTVRVAEGADAPDLVVLVDGEALPRESWGKLRAVDPGVHAIKATAGGGAGSALFEEKLVVEPRDERVVEVTRTPERPPAAAKQAEAPPAAAPPAAEAALKAAPPAPAPELPRSAPGSAGELISDWHFTAGCAGILVGSAGVVLGTLYGAKAIADVRDSAPSCPNGRCTTMSAYAQSQDALTYAHIADVAFPLGLAVAGGGVVLILTRRPAPSSAPGASAVVALTGGPGVSVRGAFFGCSGRAPSPRSGSRPSAPPPAS